MACAVPLASLPVLLGTAGGIGLLVGPAGLLWLNDHRAPLHGDPGAAAHGPRPSSPAVRSSATGLALAGRDTRRDGAAAGDPPRRGVGAVPDPALRQVRARGVSRGGAAGLENQQYTLSFRFTRLAGLVKSTLSIREIAHPIMVELAEKAKETISLHTVSGKTRVCIDAVNADSPLRSVTRAGDQVPLLQGSAARVLMAHMPQDQLSPLVTQMVKATKKTKAQVLQELALTREQGYSVSHGERLLGVSAISAPIKDVHEEVHYCLSLGGPTVRVQLHEKEFTKVLVKAASSISRLYGARLTQQSS
jgi:DNA-binding IclR family transcriptional regulator